MLNGMCSRFVDDTVLDTGEAFGPNSRCFRTTLAKHVGTGSGEKSGCYQFACAGPSRLKLKVGDYWYNCVDGGTLYAYKYGGSLKCPSPDSLCYRTPVDLNWPEFDSIDPTKGAPGTAVVIKGDSSSHTTYAHEHAPISHSLNLSPLRSLLHAQHDCDH